MTSWWPGLPDVSETRLRPSPTSNPPAGQACQPSPPSLETGLPSKPTNPNAGQDFGSSRHGWGAGGGGGERKDSLWRRDLSALGPFGAEANFYPRNLEIGSDFLEAAGIVGATPQKLRLHLPK